VDIDWDLLEAYLSDTATARRIRALSFGVSGRGHKHIYTASGTLSRTHRIEREGFEIGCVSKALLAILVDEWSRNGALDIEHPISTFFAELADDDRFGCISTQHLLQQTTGYEVGAFVKEGWAPAGSFDNLLTQIRYAPQLFKPGDVFSYDLSNTWMIGEILARTSGRSVIEQMQSSVSSFTNGGSQHHGLITAARSLGASTVDHASQRGNFCLRDAMTMRLRISELLAMSEALRDAFSSKDDDASGGPFQRTRLLEIPRSSSSITNQHLPTSYGFGVARYSNGLMGHDGRTDEHAVSIRFSPISGVALALGLSTNQGHLRTKILGDILRLTKLGEIVATAKPEESFDLLELRGRYVGSRSVEVEVTSSSTAVTIHISHSGALPWRFRGHIDARRRLIFQPSAGIWCPTFFREPGSYYPCLMLGMTALKRAPDASRFRFRLRRHGGRETVYA
jgi:hypothetical protein